MQNKSIVIFQREDDVRPSDSTFAIARHLENAGLDVYIVAIDQPGLPVRRLSGDYTPERFPIFFESISQQLSEFDTGLIRIDPEMSSEDVWMMLANFRVSHWINEPKSTYFFQSKFGLFTRWQKYSGAVRVGNREELDALIKQHTRIVTKPMLGFAGRDVERLSNSIEDRDKIKAVRFPVLGMPYFKNISNGEIRAYCFNGSVVGAMRKVPRDGEWKANSGNLARLEEVEISKDVVLSVQEIAGFYATNDVRFVAIDFVSGDKGLQLIEVNVCNPGGMRQADEELSSNITKSVANHFARL